MNHDEAHGLRVQLATALRERDEWERKAVTIEMQRWQEMKRTDAAESERDALRADLAGTQEALLALRVDYQRAATERDPSAAR